MEQKNAKLHTSDWSVIYSCKIFKGIDERELDFLLKSDEASLQKFSRGEEIFSGNKSSKILAIIVRGSATVYKVVPGNKQILMSHLSKGDVFGMAGLFTQKDFPAHIRADSEVLVLFLSKQWITQAFKLQPQLTVNYIEILSDRIQFLNRRIESFASSGNKEKLYDYLVEAAPSRGVAFALPCGLKELSDLLGMGRTSLYRSLDLLEREGKLKKTGKLFILY